MALENLDNEELFQRYRTAGFDEESGLVLAPEEVLRAIETIMDLPDFEDENNARQIVIDFIREKEESQQSSKKQRLAGGKRRKTRKGRTRQRRKGKTRKNRKSRKY